MQLPESVRRKIEERADLVGISALKRAAAAMSDAYREGRAAAVTRLPPGERIAAYLVTRMPATYAAAHMVLSELRDRLGEMPVQSVLDVGAGTGAAALAARSCFPHASLTLYERDSAFAEAAREFLPDAHMVAADASTLRTFPPHDLVIAAYSVGEMAGPVAQRLWEAARVALVVIEPGTTAGFSLVRSMRDGLLSAGAHMLAPCPVETACPIVEPDWCHFAARVERSSLHRRIKEGQLNYEDEKFSYVALARQPVTLAQSRIVRHPRHNPGLIVIETCGARGLETRRITKRNKESFRAARQSGWGDEWKD